MRMETIHLTLINHCNWFSDCSEQDSPKVNCQEVSFCSEGQNWLSYRSCAKHHQHKGSWDKMINIIYQNIEQWRYIPRNSAKNSLTTMLLILHLPPPPPLVFFLGAMTLRYESFNSDISYSSEATNLALTALETWHTSVAWVSVEILTTDHCSLCCYPGLLEQA